MQGQTTGETKAGFFADLGEGWRVEIISLKNGSGERRIFAPDSPGDPAPTHLNCGKLVNTAKRLYTQAAAIPAGEERREFLKKVLIPALPWDSLTGEPFWVTIPGDDYQSYGLAPGDQVWVEPWADWEDNALVYWLTGTPFLFTKPLTWILCRARRDGDIILVFHPDDDPDDPRAGVEAGPCQIWPVTQVARKLK